MERLYLEIYIGLNFNEFINKIPLQGKLENCDIDAKIKTKCNLC